MLSHPPGGAVVALAQPQDVLPRVFGYLAGIGACAFLATVLLYVVTRLVIRAGDEGGLWWLSAAVTLVASAAAGACAAVLCIDFIEPGTLRGLAQVAAAAAVVAGVLLGLGLSYVLSLRRPDRYSYRHF